MALEVEGTIRVRLSDKGFLNWIAKACFGVFASIGDIAVPHLKQLVAPLYDYEYLNEEELKAIKNHKYDVVETSPFQNYLFTPLYNKLAVYIPRSVAPNVLTSATFLLALIQYLLLAYYDYHFFANVPGSSEHTSMPNWIWLFSFISAILCLFFDNVDGKHARNTGNCSPIGEIFDHGVDGWRMLAPILCGFFSLYGRDEEHLTVARMNQMMLAAQLTAIAIIWQQYLTKIMYQDLVAEQLQYYLGVFYFAVYLGKVTGHDQIANGFFSATAFLMERHHLLVFYAIGVQVVFFLRQHRSCPVDLKNGRLFRPVIALLVQMMASQFLLKYSHNRIAEHDPRAFLWLTGIMCSNLLFRLLIHIMANTTPRLTTWFLNLFIIVIIATALIPVSLELELWTMRFMAILATLDHVHFVASIIRQMSRYLGIGIFMIKEIKVD